MEKVDKTATYEACLLIFATRMLRGLSSSTHTTFHMTALTANNEKMTLLNPSFFLSPPLFRYEMWLIKIYLLSYSRTRGMVSQKVSFSLISCSLAPSTIYSENPAFPQLLLIQLKWFCLPPHHGSTSEAIKSLWTCAMGSLFTAQSSFSALNNFRAPLSAVMLLWKTQHTHT